MGILLTDDMGNAKPQYANETGTGFEEWKGANGHGNVRSADGQMVSIGSTTDAPAVDETVAASVISVLKAILAKPAGGGGGSAAEPDSIGENGNIWSSLLVDTKYTSPAFDISGYKYFTLIGDASKASTFEVQFSQDTFMFFPAKKILTASSSIVGTVYETFTVASRYMRITVQATNVGDQPQVRLTLAGKV